jgi:hypothetical protein
VRLECHRADQATEWVEVGLARPSAEPDRIRPLLLLKIGGIDAGFGIDRLRLEAVETEPLHDRQHRGHLEAASDGAGGAAPSCTLDDLLGRIGARVGLEAITRLHPAESHIPEKTAKVLAAAWSEPAQDWPAPAAPRPLLLWRPEPVTAEDGPDLPLAFRWRRREFRTVAGAGPERIAPEWWLDDPDWRSGVRDYWRVVTEQGRGAVALLCPWRQHVGRLVLPWAPSASSLVALDERPRDQRPAIRHDEEGELERQRHDRGRHHHHPHRHEHRRDDEVDDQERQEDQEADLEGPLDLAQQEGGHERRERQPRTRRSSGGDAGPRGRRRCRGRPGLHEARNGSSAAGSASSTGSAPSRKGEMPLSQASVSTGSMM